MTSRSAAFLLTAALLSLSGPLLAGPEPLAAQGSFTEDSTRTMADGRVFKRHVEQAASEQGLERRETLTAPDGKTASYTLKNSYDPASQRWTRSEAGTGFDGKQWSRSQTGEPELPVFGDAPKPAPAAEARVEPKPAAKPAGPKRREIR
ncbi:MAG TPA: hypothetical protein VF050_00235 [Moraxellaceae bacterium]